jgi:hypothetical protein
LDVTLVPQAADAKAGYSDEEDRVDKEGERTAAAGKAVAAFLAHGYLVYESAPVRTPIYVATWLRAGDMGTSYTMLPSTILTRLSLLEMTSGARSHLAADAAAEEDAAEDHEPP